MPAVFFVNWFRRGHDGRFLWPGFGENSRVLEWIVDRIEGRAEGQETPIGIVATPAALDLEGLDVDTADVAEALSVDNAAWREELPLINEWFDFIGDKLPAQLSAELDALTKRLAD